MTKVVAFFDYEQPFGNKQKQQKHTHQNKAVAVRKNQAISKT